MTVIYVAPEELEAVARSMSEAADEVEHCGRELMRVAADAPSYEGQYGPWLEGMAVADDHDTRLMAEEIRERAHNLLSTAGAFRDADALDALGYVAWAATVRRLVEADYDPTGLVADWLRGPGRPPQIALKEWNLLTEEERQAILEGAWDSQWLWAHPAALAAVLTSDREGQEYLEQTALPQLSNSPTGRAVIEALLEHAPVRVIIAPEVVEDPQTWLRDRNLEWLGDWLKQAGKELDNLFGTRLFGAVSGSGLDASLQPASRNIIMISENEPGHVFAHEAVHMLARVSGVDPLTIAGAFGPEGHQPGFSLAMEREAYVVEWTIRLEAPHPSDDVDELRVQLRKLAGYDTNAAFEVVKGIGGGQYDWFPIGNDPPRHWRADLLALGLGSQVVEAIEDAAQFPPPPPLQRW